MHFHQSVPTAQHIRFMSSASSLHPSGIYLLPDTTVGYVYEHPKIPVEFLLICVVSKNPNVRRVIHNGWDTMVNMFLVKSKVTHVWIFFILIYNRTKCSACIYWKFLRILFKVHMFRIAHSTSSCTSNNIFITTIIIIISSRSSSSSSSSSLFQDVAFTNSRIYGLILNMLLTLPCRLTTVNIPVITWKKLSTFS